MLIPRKGRDRALLLSFTQISRITRLYNSRAQREDAPSQEHELVSSGRASSADYVNHIRNTVCVIGLAQSSALINLTSVATGKSATRIHPPCHPPSHDERPETARAATRRHTTTFVSLLGYPVPPPTTSSGTKFKARE